MLDGGHLVFYAYEALVGPKEPHYGRLSAMHRLVDSWVAAGHGEGEGITCPAQPDARGHPSMRIDLGLVTNVRSFVGVVSIYITVHPVGCG